MNYHRHEVLIGKKSQERIEQATIAIIGIGAIGSVAAELIARSGVKKIILLDRDTVEESNFNSQAIYTEEDIGIPKVYAAEKFLKKINSSIDIETHFEHLDRDNINIIKSDIILDCTDNLETRFLINEFSLKNKIPFVYGAAIMDKGYVFNIIPGSSCLRCILKNAQTNETCETSGILNAVAALVASVQASEALKIITKREHEKDLIYVSLRDNVLEKIKVKKYVKCPVCNGVYEYLTGKKNDITKYCGSRLYLIKKSFNFNNVQNRLEKLGGKVFKNAILYDRITVFSNRVLIKADDEKEALSIFSRYIGN